MTTKRYFGIALHSSFKYGYIFPDGSGSSTKYLFVNTFGWLAAGRAALQHIGFSALMQSMIG